MFTLRQFDHLEVNAVQGWKTDQYFKKKRTVPKIFEQSHWSKEEKVFISKLNQTMEILIMRNLFLQNISGYSQSFIRLSQVLHYICKTSPDIHSRS